MRSTNRKKRRSPIFKRILLFLVIISVAAGAGFVTWQYLRGETSQSNEETPSDEETVSQGETEPQDPEDTPVGEEPDDEEDPEPEETFIDIRISATGDVMGHASQLESAYNAEADSYDFTSVFEDVKPVIEEADLALANLETTLAGPSRPYIGYPTFNTPDAIVDGLKYAGFHALVTANNHSLDTRDEGLRRTVEVIQDKGLDTVGTYASVPDSRVLLKDVNGISVAVLGYTEHLNGMEAQYSDEELSAMVDIMDEEQIIRDIEEAKSLDPDLIVTYMHWGAEYVEEPNELQTYYAELLTREGVDIILGSHPHVIQRAEMLEVDGNEAFVAYSMGNFISNQRRETLGAGFEPTEDGVIISFDIQKNELTEETTIEQVIFTPTWVYRNREDGSGTYTYRILPVERYLENSDLSEEFNNRARESYERTMQRLNYDTTETD